MWRGSIPRNDRHAQERSQDAEHQSDDTLRGEASGDGRRRFVLAFQIGEILRVACCVTGGRNLLSRTCVEMVLWDLERFL